MLSSSRFIVAIHALSVLARSAGKGPVCSNAIASSVHTNPVVIRRLMSELEKLAIVKSTAGRVFRMHKMDPNAECPVAAQLKNVLSKPLRAAEDAMTLALGKTSLDDVVRAFA